MTAMLLSWREHQSMSIEDALARVGQEWVDRFHRNQGVPSEDKAALLAAVGLGGHPPMKWAAEDLERLLRENGPLWITDDERAGKLFSPRAYLLIGISGTGRGRGTRVDVIDPARGIQIRERVHEFLRRFVHPGAPRAYPRVQLLHLQQGAPTVSQNGGNGAVPVAPPPPAQPAAQSYAYGQRYARPMGGPAAAIGLGYTIAKDFAPSSGDISYDLYKLDGIKRPQDDAKWDSVGTWQRGKVHIRSGVLETVLGDEQSAEFDVEFSWNGHCVRDLVIKPTKTNDAYGWKLHVTQALVPRPDLDSPPPDAITAVEATFIYRHTHPVWSDAIYHETVVVYGNGKVWRSGRWTS
jgi:hypothetical protein